jgi:hypothetical protein
MFNQTKGFYYEPFENPVIEKSNSSYGNYVIKLDEVTFRFFFKKRDAVLFLENYRKEVLE